MFFVNSTLKCYHISICCTHLLLDFCFHCGNVEWSKVWMFVKGNIVVKHINDVKFDYQLFNAKLKGEFDYPHVMSVCRHDISKISQQAKLYTCF